MEHSHPSLVKNMGSKLTTSNLCKAFIANLNWNFSFFSFYCDIPVYGVIKSNLDFFATVWQAIH